MAYPTLSLEIPTPPHKLFEPHAIALNLWWSWLQQEAQRIVREII